MNIIFMGTAELSCASLEKLAQDAQFKIAAVVTQPDKPRGRDLKLQAPAVKVLAQKFGLPVMQPANARDETRIDGCGGLRAYFVAGDFGCATLWLPECSHVAPAQVSRGGADSMGH